MKLSEIFANIVFWFFVVQPVVVGLIDLGATLWIGHPILWNWIGSGHERDTFGDVMRTVWTCIAWWLMTEWFKHETQIVTRGCFDTIFRENSVGYCTGSFFLLVNK